MFRLHHPTKERRVHKTFHYPPPLNYATYSTTLSTASVRIRTNGDSNHILRHTCNIIYQMTVFFPTSIQDQVHYSVIDDRQSTLWSIQFIYTYAPHNVSVNDGPHIRHIIQQNLPKTERDRSGNFFSVFTGVRFTKG
jgi:hypothetical protein